MKITGVKRRASSPERVFVFIDGALAFAMQADAARDAGIRAGLDIDEDAVARARLESDPWLAKDAALKLLSHRPRTVAQLRTRLLAKGFAAPVVDQCLAELVHARYLDDEEFARAFILGRVRSRPRGKRVLLAELKVRGVDATVAASALRQVWADESVSDLELARKAAGRRHPRRGEDIARWRRRIHGFLSRKGFQHDTIRRVIAELGPESENAGD